MGLPINHSMQIWSYLNTLKLQKDIINSIPLPNAYITELSLTLPKQAYILNLKKIKSVLHEILFYSRKTPNTKQPSDLLKFHSNFEVLN